MAKREYIQANKDWLEAKAQEGSGIKFDTYESPDTAHEFLTWRRCLRKFVPNLFKLKK